MFKKYKNIISGSFVFLVALIMFITSFGIKSRSVGKIGPAFVPQLIAIFLALLSVSVIINGIRKLKVEGSTESHEQEATKKSGVIATLILIAVYIGLLETVGFIIMTAIYLFIQFNILAPDKNKKQPKFALIAVLVSVSVYYVFVSVFELMLPAGILG
ncbi:MAG: tripartite tricarboxylate transporter TctB family protein [Clostridia bacterium]